VRLRLLVGACLIPALAGAQLPPDTPLITNGAVTVTAADFEAFLLRVPENNRIEVRASSERIGNSLESVYTNRVLAGEARRLGLDQDASIRLRMKQIEESYLAFVWSERYAKEVKIPDLSARAEELYRLNKEQFREPERFNGSYLVVSTKGRTNEAALERATDLRKRALAGEKFEDLIREFTDDPAYSKRKGKIARATILDLEPPVAEAAFALKSPGEISPPVMGKAGYLLVQMESRIPSRMRPFEEVREAITAQERERLAKEATERRIGELKNTAQTKVYEDNINKLRVEIPPSLIEQAIREGKATLPER
jgi:peptidyl-prolyl cis-trans isomerase C